jgi:hypothetical protein
VELLTVCQPVGDGPQSRAQEEKSGRGIEAMEPTAEGGRIRNAIRIFERRCCALERLVLQEVSPQRLASSDQAVMGVRQRENGKEGDGQVAGSTDAAANFDPVVSFIMSLLAPPAVPSNRIAQALRATGRDLLVAASSPVEIWVARIPAKWDKDNRTAWEALFLNRTCQDLCSDEGFHFPTKLE